MMRQLSLPLPLLMQSLPNSGSTWLADMLAKHLPDCRYSMEFFNPARNERYETTLSRQFGSELIASYRNIASAGNEFISDDIRNTWGRERFTFTKEVFSPYKLGAFNAHFQCFVLLRSAAESFPPSRPRVWAFYEAGWWSLREAGITVTGATMRERALSAHAVMSARIREDAAMLNVPIIDYQDLFGPRETVRATLQWALSGSEHVTAALVAEIMATRVVAERAEAA
jgi:hypothetical protein